MTVRLRPTATIRARITPAAPPFQGRAAGATRPRPDGREVGGQLDGLVGGASEADRDLEGEDGASGVLAVGGDETPALPRLVICWLQETTLHTMSQHRHA